MPGHEASCPYGPLGKQMPLINNDGGVFGLGFIFWDFFLLSSCKGQEKLNFVSILQLGIQFA